MHMLSKGYFSTYVRAAVQAFGWAHCGVQIDSLSVQLAFCCPSHERPTTSLSSTRVTSLALSQSQPKSYYVHNLSRLRHDDQRSADLQGVDLDHKKPVVSTLLAALTSQLMSKQDMKLDKDDSQSTLR